MNFDKFFNKPFELLKLSVILVFIGRAYQHLIWDAPFRAFFWDESLLKPFVEGFFNVSWGEYVTSLKMDSFIQGTILFFGILYAVAAFSTYKFNFKSNFFKIVIISGGVGLVFLAYLLMKEKFYRLSQFFEYSIQFSIPFILVYYKKEFVKNNLQTILKILIAAVFVSHGLFAIGYYPVPGNFLGMVINIFDFSESSARFFLLIAGILDMLVAILIFVPGISKYALIYASIWGFLTAFARIVAGFYIDFIWLSINLNLFETIYRLPHGLIPLIVLLLNSKKKVFAHS